MVPMLIDFNKLNDSLKLISSTTFILRKLRKVERECSHAQIFKKYYKAMNVLVNVAILNVIS